MMQQIFSINPGRAGSHYLYTLFRHAINTCSNHEPDPKMQGTEMAQWNEGNENPLRELTKVRLEQIRRAHASGKVWFSANNAFIKGYGYLLMEHFAQEETGVVILNRDPERIARSIVRNGWTVAGEKRASDKSNAWLLWPGMKRNLTPPCPSDDPLDLALWYVHEVYARGRHFVAQFPRVTYYTVNVDELNRLDKCLEMFSKFGLKADDELKRVVGIGTNCGR